MATPVQIETYRAQAEYRITFPIALATEIDVLAHRIAEVAKAFPVVEVRYSVEAGSLAAYALVPSDVTLEALDRKADEIRARWAAEDAAR